MTKREKGPSPSPPVLKGPQSKPRFDLRYTPDAATDIRSLDGSVRNRLRKVLDNKLAVDPEGYGMPLRGPLANYWKLEFLNHRIIYRIYPQHHVAVVCAVGIRKQGDAKAIYRQLESVAKTGRLAEQLASVLKNLLLKR